MSSSKIPKLFDQIVAYTPLIALLLSWVVMAFKTVRASSPQLWWLAVLTLPAFGLLVAAGVKVVRGAGRPAGDSSRETEKPAPPAAPDPG